MRLENVFGWSKSRDEQFRECRRKYFYDKYAAWGGWEKDAPNGARSCYVLKNLKNRWAWKGESVHHIIENVLKAARDGRVVSLEEALTQLTETMRRDYRSSKQKKYWQDPKRNVGLFEHEYEKPVSDDTWKKIHDESTQCLRNFYDSGVYRELLADDARSWLVIEDLDEYFFDDAKIYVKLDFARRKNDTIEIYDWKTGKTSGDTDVQIGTYTVFAVQKWGIPLEKVRAFLLNLSSQSPVAEEKRVTPALVENAESIMRESIAHMRELLSDPARNVPKPAADFPFTDDTRICGTCNFYKICEKYHPSRPV
jgi:hypothetical protein